MTVPASVLVGARIRSLRKLHGLSQSALGARCGVGQTQVSRWERGRTPVPVAHRRYLAEALGQVEASLFLEEYVAEREAMIDALGTAAA